MTHTQACFTSIQPAVTKSSKMRNKSKILYACESKKFCGKEGELVSFSLGEMANL